MSEVIKNGEAKRPNIIKKAVRWAGALTASALIVGGGYFMFRNDNMEDFMDLKDFTSPEHQEDRCNTQAAFDAQVKMREFFDAKGGVTEEEAAAMAPVVGLDQSEIESLLTTELFDMDYDCHVATASSQEATQGLAAVAFGAGALAGVAVAAATRKRQ